MNSANQLISRTRSRSKKTSGLLAIDIGSTVTRVMYDGVVVWHEPSCLAIHLPTDQVVAVGQKAYGYLGKTGNQVKILFPVSNGVVADQHGFELLLQSILRSIQKKASWWNLLFGFHGSYGTLATVSPLERKVLKESLAKVGLGSLKEYTQMQAASAALQLSDRAGQSYCIVSVGGQVTEMAIVTAGKVEKARRLKAGGITCTERIQEVVLENKECVLSWQTAELLKLQLGVVSDDATFAKHKASVRGKNVTTHLGQTITIANEDIARVGLEYAEEVLHTLQQLFSESPTEVVTNCLENGVFLIGGGAAFKGLAHYLQKHLQVEVSVAADPELTVVRGLAALYR